MSHTPGSWSFGRAAVNEHLEVQAAIGRDEHFGIMRAPGRKLPAVYHQIGTTARVLGYLRDEAAALEFAACLQKLAEQGAA